MYFKRKLDLNRVLKKKSAFLLGPRSCGKTFLLHKTVQADRTYDLLNLQTLKRLLIRPSLIYEEIRRNREIVVVDEIQKIPELLSEVHRAIEEKQTRFLLTGSSARKLKRSQSNLLGGRATHLELFPLMYNEIPDFDLNRYLHHGGIPRHYLASMDDVQGELDDYTSLYLKEEILDEAVTRNLEGFSRFLEIMAIHSGDELALESFASDCGIKVGTFRNYIEVLKDTLIGFEVPAFTKTKKRKAITRSKLFLFDVGIGNFLANRGRLTPKSELYGKAFEHFIALELRAFINYNHLRAPLAYWRSTSQFEVDFIVGNQLAIEVKSTELVHERMLKGLRAFAEEKIAKHYIVISRDHRPRRVGNIEILPWQMFLAQLWQRHWL